MIVLRNRPKEGCEALGLGVFDGLHLGHQEIIKQCSHVLSFDPHPDQLLNKNRKIKLLTTVQERECLFPRIVTLTFTRAIATLRAHQFLNEVVLKELSPKRMVVGYDFKFGYKKEGDLTVLKAWGVKHGVEIDVQDPFLMDGQPVKSAVIRRLVASGEIGEANRLLGYDYVVLGEVVKGEQRGRELGFPTANLKVGDDKCMPGLGVYKGHVTIQGRDRICAIYVGRKPTFKGTAVGIELHMPGFDGDVYGECVQLRIQARLRPEMRFENADALREQIKKDISRVV